MDKKETVKFHVHMISDSTGETLIQIMHASVAQFENVEPVEHLSSLIRNKKQLNDALNNVKKFDGIVMFTLVNTDLLRTLEEFCAQREIPAIAVLDPIQATMSAYLGASMKPKAGAQHGLGDEYYRRIEAMNYSMAHDDGQGDDLDSANVILLGISRTSKTPTSIYLGHRGIRTANIPIIPDISLPDALFKLNGPLIIGLTASPERIVQIRRNRLLNIKEKRATNYVEKIRVKEEVIYARRLYNQNGWPSIDVTRRSIEETAAKVINLLTEHREAQQ